MKLIVKQILPDYKQRLKPIMSVVSKNTANKNSSIKNNIQKRSMFVSNCTICGKKK